jgi:hypothetical protein
MSRRDYSQAGGLPTGCSNPYEEPEPMYAEECYGCEETNPVRGWSDRTHYDRREDTVHPFCRKCARICGQCGKDASEDLNASWVSSTECLECYIEDRRLSPELRKSPVLRMLEAQGRFLSDQANLLVPAPPVEDEVYLRGLQWLEGLSTTPGSRMAPR